MKQIVTRAIMLNRINYGEADRILKVITADHGKISLLAKGVRREKSKLAGGLELFSVTNLTFIEGKSDLKIVISTRLDQYFGQIVKDIKLTEAGYEFIKMIDDHTHDDCDEEYFELLKNGLETLNSQEEDLQLIKVWFMVQLLVLSGSGLNLEKQAGGRPLSEDKTYDFSFDDMGFFERQNGPYAPKHIKFLRLLTKVSRPGNMIQVAKANEVAADLQNLLARTLKHNR